MDACIKKTTCEVREFDNDLVRRPLQNIHQQRTDRNSIQIRNRDEIASLYYD